MDFGIKIKINNLWQFRGVTVEITEELSDVYLKKGAYTFVTKEEHGELMLYSSENGTSALSEWDDDDEINIFHTKDYTKRVDNLVEAQTIQCISLIGDGWSENNQYMNLTPYLNDLKSYRALQSLLKADD